jgi:hypothetical protein
VRVGVRVEHLPHGVFVEQHAAELGVPLPQRAPLLGGQLPRLQERAGVQVGVHGGQRDQVRRFHGVEQRGDLAALGQGRVEGLAAAVQRGARGGAGEGEPRRPSSSRSRSGWVGR